MSVSLWHPESDSITIRTCLTNSRCCRWEQKPPSEEKSTSLHLRGHIRHHHKWKTNYKQVHSGNKAARKSPKRRCFLFISVSQDINTANMVHFLNWNQHLTSESDPGTQRGPPRWHTQQQQLQLPSCVSSVSPELFLDLGIDAFGLLRLLAEATSHRGV